MPSPSSAYDLIVSTFRLIGVTAVGETPTADEANDALNTANDLLESWSTESLSIWQTDNEVFPLVAGQQIYTIGPGANFNTTRPVRISGAFCTVNAVDFPVEIIGLDDFNDISVKQTQSDITERLCYINTNTTGVIKIWPVPTTNATTLSLNTDLVLTKIPTLATLLSFPPGYMLAFRYTLGVMLWPEYKAGQPIDPTIASIAQGAHANIKRANKVKRTLRFDTALTDGGTAAIWERGY
jgi:hypothetical protein